MLRLPVSIIGLVSAAVLSACGASEPADSHGTSTDPNAATGFITSNTTPPSTATDSRGDGVLRDGDGRPYGYGLLGEPFPEISGPMAGGAMPASAEIEDWTIVYVWGMWCGDCRADAPYVAELYQATQQDAGLDFLSVHVPASATRLDEAFGVFGSIDAYFESEGYSYPVIIDEDASLRARLKVAWTPTYLLVSPQGLIEGFRTDLSVSGEEPVEAFLADVAEVKAGWTPSETPADAVTLNFTPDGIAGLKGQTAFDRVAIAAAFPGHRVEGGTATVEDEPYPVFHIRAEGDSVDAIPRVTLEPSWDRAWVRAVLTRHSEVTGPSGEQIGAMRLADLPEATRAGCEPGVEAYSEMLICVEARGESQFAWIFEGPEGYAGFFPTAAADVLGTGQLVEMRYLPPRPPRD